MRRAVHETPNSHVVGHAKAGESAEFNRRQDIWIVFSPNAGLCLRGRPEDLFRRDDDQSEHEMEEDLRVSADTHELSTVRVVQIWMNSRSLSVSSPSSSSSIGNSIGWIVSHCEVKGMRLFAVDAFQNFIHSVSHVCNYCNIKSR